MRKSPLFLFVLLIIIIGCVKVEKGADTHQALIDELKAYILAHQQSPEGYVISKFKEHDVVFLGEMHRVKHDPELIQKLIPLLHENGIYIMATEFARSEDQPLIDSLLCGEVYDEQLARLITFKHYVQWAYQEYVNIYKAAWALNQFLPNDARRFRVLALNCSPDWSVMKTPADREVDSLPRLVWGGCGDRDWADVILKQVEKGEKVLVYSGMHHAFSEYLQPIVNDTGGFIRFENDRIGRYVYEAIGKRAVTIYLHSLWWSAEGYKHNYVRPVDGIVDNVMASLGEQFKPVGFDVAGSPFGKLAPRDAVYCAGYENFTLGNYCDGYIYQKPLREYEVVTFIDNFVTEANLDVAQQQAPDPWFRNAPVEDFVKWGREWLNQWQKRYREI